MLNILNIWSQNCKNMYGKTCLMSIFLHQYFVGWKRPAKYFGLSSLYDGCMTVKLAHNGSVLAFFREIRVMHFLPEYVFDYGRKAWRESPKKRRDALKRAILTKKSKNFIKAKLTVSESCLLGLLGFLIFWILRGDLL